MCCNYLFFIKKKMILYFSDRKLLYRNYIYSVKTVFRYNRINLLSRSLFDFFFSILYISDFILSINSIFCFSQQVAGLLPLILQVLYEKPKSYICQLSPCILVYRLVDTRLVFHLLIAVKY